MLLEELNGGGRLWSLYARSERGLPEAQRIMPHAFGTFLGAQDLDTFWTDFDYVYGRFGAEHTVGFVADEGGALAGLNFATRWGSVGSFGPLSTRPDLWNRRIAQPLVAAISDAFREWGVTHAGLSHLSAQHQACVAVYGFYPRYLTPIMSAPAAPDDTLHPSVTRYSALSVGERQEAETASRALTDTIYEGLDLRGEIRTVAARGLGDTLLLWDAVPLGAGQGGRRGLPVREVRRGAAGTRE